MKNKMTAMRMSQTGSSPGTGSSPTAWLPRAVDLRASVVAAELRFDSLGTGRQ